MAGRVLFTIFLSLGIALGARSAPIATPPRTATILCYHIVESPHDPKMRITRAQFKAQLDYLSSTGYTIVKLSDVIDYVEGRKPTLPENAVVITFDDGWRSTYTEAFPEMQRRRLPFTLFVYPNFIGQSAYAVTWAQVREMAAAGVDIQSHSLSHGFLTQRRHAKFSPAEYALWLSDELAKSKKIIEEHTGKPVTAIAYPYGDYDEPLMKATADAGYTAGLTCDYGRNSRETSPLRLRRVSVYSDTSFAKFREHMGTNSLRIASPTPLPGSVFDQSKPVVSAKIANPKKFIPSTVGMAIIGGSASKFSYDATNGIVSAVMREPAQNNRQQALVWGTDAVTGKRYEALWSFYLTPPRPEPLPLPPFLPLPTVDVAGSGATSSTSRHAVTEKSSALSAPR